MSCQDLGDLVPHSKDRIERGHRLLEDHGYLCAADLPHFAGEQWRRSRPSNKMLPDTTFPGIGNEIQNGKGGYGLAAARFADQAQHPALLQTQAQVVDSLYHA